MTADQIRLLISLGLPIWWIELALDRWENRYLPRQT